MQHDLTQLLTQHQESPLFSTYGMSNHSYDNEGRTVDALLWVLRHVPEAGALLFTEAATVSTHARVRIQLDENGANCVPDAILRTPQDSLLLEAKIGSNRINLDQIGTYVKAAGLLGISRIATISNEASLELRTDIKHTHLSWATIVAELEWINCVQPNELVSEFLTYAASDKVGIKTTADQQPAWVNTMHLAHDLPPGNQRNVLLDAIRQLRGTS